MSADQAASGVLGTRAGRQWGFVNICPRIPLLGRRPGGGQAGGFAFRPVPFLVRSCVPCDST